MKLNILSRYQGEAIIPNLKIATYLDILNDIKT